MRASTLLLALALMPACGGNKNEPDPVAIARTLESGDPEARRMAAVALGKLGDKAKPVVPELQKRVLDPDPEVRLAVVEALAAIGADGRRGLSAALNDGDAKVREAAALGLASLGPNAAPTVANLIAALEDEESAVAEAARRALVAIGADAIEGLQRELVSGPATTRQHATVALSALGEPALPGLILALEANHPEARKAALAAIATILESTDPPPELPPALEACFTDTNPQVAEAARRLHARIAQK